MLTLFLIAGLITVALAFVVIAFICAGIIFVCIKQVRFLAPFILFVPTFAALGTGVGAWGLAYLAKRLYPMGVLPFWGFVIGLPLGFITGMLLGFGIAFGIYKLTNRNSKQPELKV